MFKSGFLLLLLCLYSLTANAYLPLAESLLRNNNNEEVSKSLARLTFELTDNQNTQQSDEQNQRSLFVKIIIYKQQLDENSYKYHAVQTIHEQTDYEIASIVSLKVIDDVMKKVTMAKQQSLTDFFYALMIIQTFNDSSVMMKFLNKYTVVLPTNESLVNSEKKGLLKQYKEYLSLARQREKEEKKNEALNQDPSVSPLEPKTEEDKKLVNEILNKQFYKESALVSITKKDNDFFYMINSNGLNALFGLEKLRLHQFKMNLEGQELMAAFRNYILYDGVHEIPRDIAINYQQKKYEIKINSFRYINFSDRTFEEMVSSYKEAVKNRSMHTPIPLLLIN